MYITSKYVIHKIFKWFVICGTQAKKLRSGPLPFYNLVKHWVSRTIFAVSMPKTLAKTSASAQGRNGFFSRAGCGWCLGVAETIAVAPKCGRTGTWSNTVNQEIPAMPQSRNHDGVTVQSVCLYFFHWWGKQILKANMKKASSPGGCGVCTPSTLLLPLLLIIVSQIPPL